MTAKTWIKIKRGLLDPKHRMALGVRVWLFIYIIDRADWDTGMIEGWKDQEAADDLEMPVRTLTTQRQELETGGYIACKQSLHGQTITIHNWTNPREYSGEVLNQRDHGTQKCVPLDGHGTRKRVPYGPRKPRTIYLNPHLKESQWEVPPSLQTLEFEDTFFEFLQMRKEIKKPVTHTAGERLLKRLSKYPVRTAIGMLAQSIENNWQGVFELHRGHVPAPGRTPDPDDGYGLVGPNGERL
jgi:hypothetical protein